MTRHAARRCLWAIAILVVLLYALIPVIWIASLSLKPPAELADGKLLLRDIHLDNYDTIFSTNDVQPRRWSTRSGSRRSRR